MSLRSAIEMAVVKRLHETETTVDSLSDMPESLQLHILSFLDARHAVETSVLSKSWISSWTCVPVLNFSSDSFKQLHVFDDFVLNALSHRQPVKLDRLTFKHSGECNARMLKQVFDYALLHGVEELEASIVPPVYNHENWIWPIWSSDSLTSLKLKSKYAVSCSFLEPPRSVGSSFKNLTCLHLNWVVISDLDPFSGFPALEKLTLIRCYLQTKGKALNVHALQLSEATFVYNSHNVNHCEFTTPKLRYLKWKGSGFPRLKAHLPVLDTAIINYDGRCRINQEKKTFDNLLMMFNTLYAAKSLTLYAHVVHLLALFLLNAGCSPFRDLKYLNLNFKVPDKYIQSRLFFSETLQLVPGVKAYLLHKSHDAKCAIINYPDVADSPCSTSQKSMTQSQAAQQTGPSALSRPKRMVKKPSRFLD